MDSLWSSILVFILCLCHSTIFADRKFGCLFEDELCTAFEFCTNDGVFGRCQDLPGSDLYTYDVSPSSLQRLRTLLQRLAHRGLTWRDDITQQVISRELSKLRRVPLRRLTPPTLIAPPPTHSRDRKLRPGGAGLNGRLQQYLKDLGFFPQSAAPQGPQQERPSPQDFWGDSRPGSVQPEPRGWGKGTLYSLRPQGPRAPGFLSTARLSPSATYAGKDPGRVKALASRLESYLAGLPSEQNQPGMEGPEPEGRPRGKVHYFSYISHPPEDQEAKVGSEDGPKPPKPKIEKLVVHLGSDRPPSKEPLSPTDERFIQGVVDRLGNRRVNMEELMGPDLDELAKVITGALQVVDGEENGATETREGRETKRKPLDNTEQEQEEEEEQEPDQDLDAEEDQELRIVQEEELSERELPGQQINGADKEPDDKDAAFLSKLLEYLDLDPFEGAPDSLAWTPDRIASVPAPSESFWESPPQRTVGLENVRSRTTQGRVAAPTDPWEERGTAQQPLGGEVVGAESEVDEEVERWAQGTEAPAEKPDEEQKEEQKEKEEKEEKEVVRLGVKAYSSRGKDSGDFGYIITDSDFLPTDLGLRLMEHLAQWLNLHLTDLQHLTVLGPALTFRVGPNRHNVSTADLAHTADQQKKQLEKETGLKILEAGVGDKGSLTPIPVVKETRVESGQFLLLTVLSMLFILALLGSSGAIFCLRQRSSHLAMKEKLAGLSTDAGVDATATYQELCRQRMAVRASERVERPETLRHSRLNSVSSQFSDGPAGSPSARSSTSSWCDDPVPSNMDISTGHMILSYMEDHLQNKNRLESEWEALCGYQAEPSACTVGRSEQNTKRNRTKDVVAYDHSRIFLKAEMNHGNSDYINASPIMDHDPRNPTYISSQGPLPSTVADFWQMVWESGCVVVVMLTPLSENGVKQCHPYWPDEGSDIYHIYEVHLVSEHIWCEDFLVRSFYLKNLQNNETRTVTQFHFLSWPDRSIPDCARTLLDFRRKVNRCYRGRSCPIIVHCSDGAGRSGTYILIDMVLNRMSKGAKEIDIAATLEHLRDQRHGMVQTKEQFEFALTAVAEEVNAILKALPQ